MRSGFDVYTGQPYLAKEERFIIHDLGIHVLDLARFLLGEVEHALLRDPERQPRHRRRGRGDDPARARVAARSAVVDCSYEAKRDPDPFPETLLEMEGRRGSLVLSPGLDLKVTSDGRTTTRSLRTPTLPWTAEPWHVAQESVLNTQRHWVECLKAGREPETSGRDNLKTYALAEAAYESARTHRAVTPAA